MYLQATGTPFFAVLHQASGPPRETAVLLCPPFGWEDMCTYRIRREWAEHLARGGYTTLRIDLPGSGDSAGDPTDPGQLQAWTQTVDAAARWLRRPLGATVAAGDGEPASAERVAVVGIGLCGMVSCRAALDGAPIDELVLWSVPTRGHTILRELRAFSAMEVANVLEADEQAPEGDPEDDGAVVANGYLLSAETVQELERLDLGEIEPPAAAPQRALLLGRDGLRVDKDLPAVLEQAGVQVTIDDGPGYGAMMQAEPLETQPPTAVFELVSSWLGQAAPTAGAALVVTEPEPTAHEEIVLHRSNVALRERPVFFDGPGGRLFGVLTEPLGARRELTGVLLNAGFQRRTGPNRMWVEVARRWAAQGVPTLRLDTTGIGDFDGEGAFPGQITEFYKPLYVEQACAALEMLAGRGLPPRFLMLGFCSGAYCAAHAALADERVAAVLMLNPRTLVIDDWQWRHTLRHMRHLRERMLLPSTWRKLLRGEIRLEKHLETGRTLVGRVASAPTLARERIVTPRRERSAADGSSAREPIEDLFDALDDRDQRAVLMFTGKEPLHRELAKKGVLDRLDRWPSLELAIMGTSADTHTLTPVWLQRQAHALADRVLRDELGRLAG